MSLEAYKIAVKISLVENVTRGLMMMSRHFKSTDADAKALEARLKSIGKMVAVGGGLMAAGGVGLKILQGPLEEAAKYQTLLERFKQFGMGDAAMRDAEKFVEAQDIMGASQRDMMRYFIEAQGVFRESGAKTVSEQLAAAKMAAPMIAKMQFASQGLSEDGKRATEAKQMDMLRFVEQAGGLKSAARFNELMNSGFKAIQSSGGNVDFTQYRQFMSRGGSSAMGLSSRSLFADLEPIIGEMKGSTAGNALMTAFNRMNGIVKLPNQVAHQLVKAGLWDGRKIEWNKNGGIKQFLGDGNPMVNAALFGSDPIEYYRKMILPMYAGMTDQQRIVQNAKIFGRTGGAFFNLVDRQLPTIMRSRDAYNKAHGITPEYDAVGQTYAGREAALTAKWQTLLLVLGKDGGLLDMATKGLGMLTTGLQTMIKFVREHPTLTKFAVSGLALISVLAIASGAILEIAAAFRLLRIVGAISGLLRYVGVGLSILRGGLAYLPMLFRFVVAALGPVGLAIAAIAAVAWLVWNNWKEVKAALIVIWSDIKGAVIALFHGDILGALKLFGHALALGFQTIFNTIIAGLNSILPAAWQISKFNFAGDPTQPPGNHVGNGGGQPVQVHTTVNMDGHRVATIVTKHQAKAAGRPNTGSSGFDSSRAMPAVAMSAMK